MSDEKNMDQELDLDLEFIEDQENLPEEHSENREKEEYGEHRKKREGKPSGKSSGHKKKRKKKKGKDTLFLVNVGILVAIAAIVIFAVVRLAIWNKGQKVEIDVDSNAYDVEVLDQVFLQNAEDLKGHEDDGVETILCIGNDPFADDTSDNGLAAMIAEKTGATVYNAAFPSSTVAIKNASFDNSYPMDLYSFFYVSQFLVQQDYTALREMAPYMGDEQFVSSVETLDTVDLDKVDTLVVMYDGLDYLNGSICYDPDNDLNPQTFAGAYLSGLQTLHETYPYIRIVVMSMTYCRADDEEGNNVDADNTDFGNGKLPTYLTKLIDVCETVGVTMIDNYYGTFDVSNYEDYLIDNIHLNEKAKEIIASHFTRVVYPNASTNE